MADVPHFDVAESVTRRNGVAADVVDRVRDRVRVPVKRVCAKSCTRVPNGNRLVGRGGEQDVRVRQKLDAVR